MLGLQSFHPKLAKWIYQLSDRDGDSAPSIELPFTRGSRKANTPYPPCLAGQAAIYARNSIIRCAGPRSWIGCRGDQLLQGLEEDESRYSSPISPDQGRDDRWQRIRDPLDLWLGRRDPEPRHRSQDPSGLDRRHAAITRSRRAPVALQFTLRRLELRQEVRALPFSPAWPEKRPSL